MHPTTHRMREPTLRGPRGRKASDAAEMALLERRIVTIPAKDWEAFEAWVRAPARRIAAVARLAGRASGSRK